MNPSAFGIELRRPFADAVQRLAGEEHVLEQERDADRRGDPAASIGAWEVRAEKLVEAHAFEDVIDDGQGGDSVGGQGPPAGASDLTGAWRLGRAEEGGVFWVSPLV